MSIAADTLSGKGHRDENFPVASWLISERHRSTILAFYRFARAADDIADHPALPGDEKIARLNRMQAALDGSGPADPLVEPLRAALAERKLSYQHAFDLLDAFRLDAQNRTYETWQDLIGYCRLSAMPVGRFVLDVHGEDQALWPASDAVCAALQIINHLQDCRKDYKAIDRVYLPGEIMRQYHATREMIGADQASPQLLGVIRDMARQTKALLDFGRPLIPQIHDPRLGLEISVIHTLAEHLVRRLQRADPLSGSVHHGKSAFAFIGLSGVARYCKIWLTRKRPTPPSVR